MKKQSSLEDEGWIKVERKHEDNVEREYKKLDVGESIEGLLTGRIRSTKYEGKSILHIKVKDDPLEKYLLGTYDIDRQFDEEGIEIGEFVFIERLTDEPSEHPNDTQIYDIYHKKEE